MRINTLQKFLLFLAIIAIISIFLWYVPNTSINYAKDTNNQALIPSKESCITCHTIKNGFSRFHNPNIIGCTSCHLGNPYELKKEAAHNNMVLIPGNLSDAPKTCGKCHANQLNNVQHSLMTTNSGIVAVDKYIFNETSSPDLQYHIKDLKHTPADEHLRTLCANCHLGAEKKVLGPITALSRGGGCNACHLNYTQKAKEQLSTYKTSFKRILPNIHPSTDLQITDTHCFGCHSRSSRISTNYIGLHETLKTEVEIADDTTHVILADGRIYSRQLEDIHHTKGLLCIDCHTSGEVMGDGVTYLHEEDAIKIQCSDCHFKEAPNTIDFEDVDIESQMIFMIRDFLHDDKPLLATKIENHVLINTYVDSLNRVFLISKKDKSIHPIVPQGASCTKTEVHENLSCSACHTSWAPRCIACHTTYDPEDKDAFDLLEKKDIKGRWVEYVDAFLWDQPTLGVKISFNDKNILPAVPGMIMTIDYGSIGEDKVEKKLQFHRLFAPNAPHTTQKHARDCKSCHSNPIALGYGDGNLTYIMYDKLKTKGKKYKTGKWSFDPSYAIIEHDGLPQDAWIPFLKPLDEIKRYSTRTNFRPFNLEEQQKILLVGTCLECHKEDDKVIVMSLDIGMEQVLLNRSKQCILPEFLSN